MRVLVTGAAGRVGAMLRPRLARPGRTLRLLDLVPVDPEPGEEAVTADLTDEAAVAAAMRGVVAVVHLGGLSRERPWADTLHVNVHGTYVLLEAARRAGVRHVVLAGSHHAVGFHPRTPGAVRSAARDLRAPDAPQPPSGHRALARTSGTARPAEAPDYLFPRPDTFYGVSKVAMEALGSLYHDRFGMNVVVIRLGSCAESPADTRGLSTWLSPGDCARLVEASLAATGFHVVWGVSANTRRWWSLEEGRAIGYHPEDDAEPYAAALIAAHGEPDLADPVHALVGGVFCTRELGGSW
ncbi:NAD-dependent epimerase/dehydratase family protein [Streptosporangium sp. CA-135522]|uniref:NAD-dependent epimerase/dehydratase family protein n=1 Tax=Streptosporangium sp. CA-135522 TaxID=3240072 RepID=UPI003D8D69B3